MWIFFAFGSALFAGMTAVLAKIGIKNVDSNLATAIRTVIILLFSWLMVFIVGSTTTVSQIDAMTLTFLILSGIATGASWLCYFKALQLGDVNKVTPIDKSSTVLTMILAFFILSEPISVLKFVAMILIGVGTYLMIEKKATKTKAVEGNKWLIYAFGSAIFASLTAILGKIGITNIDSNLGTAIRTIVVFVMAWIVVLVTRKQGEIKNINKTSWWFIGLSGITTGLSWLCYYKALQDGLASVVVPIDKLSIVITILFSRLFLKERLTAKSRIGLTAIVAGTLLLIL